MSWLRIFDGHAYGVDWSAWIRSIAEGILKHVSSLVLLGGFCLFSAAVLFLPVSVLSLVGIELGAIERSRFGLIFVGTASFMIIIVLQKSWTFLSREWRTFQNGRVIIEKLRNPSFFQRQVIDLFASGQASTQYLDALDGDVAELDRLTIIIKLCNQSIIGRGSDFAYALHPWVKQYIRKHSELGYGTNDSSKVSFEKIEQSFND